MSAITPKFCPSHLLLIASIALLGAVGASAAAAAGFEDLSRWVVPAEGPTPPEAGTCIDPNGKPRPCDGSEAEPPGTGRETRSVAPRG